MVTDNSELPTITGKVPEEIRTSIYFKMSPAQKWDEVCRLREAAWSLKKAAVCMKNPDWSDEQIETEVKKIFLYATT